MTYPKKLPPLSEAIGRMSIAQTVDDMDETTHDVTIAPEAQIKSGVNPWSEGEREKIIQNAPPMVEQHEFIVSYFILVAILNNTGFSDHKMPQYWHRKSCESWW